MSNCQFGNNFIVSGLSQMTHCLNSNSIPELESRSLFFI